MKFNKFAEKLLDAHHIAHTMPLINMAQEQRYQKCLKNYDNARDQLKDFSNNNGHRLLANEPEHNDKFLSHNESPAPEEKTNGSTKLRLTQLGGLLITLYFSY